jgi:hypothetical protein
MKKVFVTPQPNSPSPTVERGAKQDWTNPIVNKAALTPADAIKNDPRKNPINPSLPNPQRNV